MPRDDLSPSARPFQITCHDDVVLGADIWRSALPCPHGTVIINPATGVAARYYHRYAAFLARHGFDVITYDYRGIGRSAPATLRGCRFLWRDWGELDFDAVLRCAATHRRAAPLLVVGHSIGGFLPGLSENGRLIDRMLTVGAQFGYWGDYAWPRRARLYLKWHVAMPALTGVCGFFPGKRIGWLEDLPAGVAFEWAFRRALFELSHPPGERQDVVRRLASVPASILAVTVSDDPIGTPRAVRRALSYYTGAQAIEVLLSPGDLYQPSVGHFGLFRDRQKSDFWLDTLVWLRDGANPWPQKTLPPDRSDRRRGADRPYIVRYY